MISPITQTVKSRLVELLREEIVRGVYLPGETLRLETIAAQYEVSTMPVRQALSDLEAEGLVEVIPRRGAVVTELSPADLEDIYDIRATLEELATLVAVPRLTKETVELLSSLVKQIDENLGNVGATVALNHQLHNTLYAASGRKHLYELTKNLRNRTQHYLRAFIDDIGGMPNAQDEHRAIVEACKQGDAEKASALMREHVVHVGQVIVDYVREREKSNN